MGNSFRRSKESKINVIKEKTNESVSNIGEPVELTTSRNSHIERDNDNQKTVGTTAGGKKLLQTSGTFLLFTG